MKIISTINDKIQDEKLQNDIEKWYVKYINRNILQAKKYYQLIKDQSRIVEQDKFTFSPLKKVLEIQTKAIEDQGEKDKINWNQS